MGSTGGNANYRFNVAITAGLSVLMLVSMIALSFLAPNSSLVPFMESWFGVVLGALFGHAYTAAEGAKAQSAILSTNAALMDVVSEGQSNGYGGNGNGNGSAAKAGAEAGAASGAASGAAAGAAAGAAVAGGVAGGHNE